MPLMSNITGFDVVVPREYMQTALLVSLLSVWVLVGLFHYLNRYTKREYFSIWTAAWLFYALWLTLGLTAPNPAPGSFLLVAREWCISISGAFLLWGSLAFLESRTPQGLFGLFIAFLLAWSYVGRATLDDPFYVQVPTFTLIGLGSIFSGMSFYGLWQERRFVAIGMLFLGFSLWGLYLMAYPICQRYDVLFNIGFLCSAALQLFIAVSMIVLVLEEARLVNARCQQQIESIRSERRSLQLRVFSAEEQCRSLFTKARLDQEFQTACNELRQTQQSLVDQERLSALSQMARGMAHDINNALSPILTFSEMLLEQPALLVDPARKKVESIRASAADIARIVTRMIEVYRRWEDRDRLRLFSLKQVVQEVIELANLCWRDVPLNREATLPVETDLADGLPELYGHESEVREALSNLVLDAVDALSKGARIRITAGTLCQNPLADPGSKPTHLFLQVSEGGGGPDQAVRSHSLEPFFSTRSQPSGAGLGLAMLHGVMTRHEGRVEVQQDPKAGATVRLVFPLRQPPEHEAPPQAVTAGLASLRMLCIDDEPLLRELLKEVLELHGHQVAVADGGQAGIDAYFKAQEEGLPFDVVVTDLGMPGLNGRQVAERIKTASPEVPIIMLTGWGAMIEERGEGVAQVDAVLSKPPRMNALLETLARVAKPRGTLAPRPSVRPEGQPALATAAAPV